jgi:hypothetical protein
MALSGIALTFTRNGLGVEISIDLEIFSNFPFLGSGDDPWGHI